MVCFDCSERHGVVLEKKEERNSNKRESQRGEAPEDHVVGRGGLEVSENGSAHTGVNKTTNT